MYVEIEPEVKMFIEGIATRSDYTPEQVAEMILNTFYHQHPKGG